MKSRSLIFLFFILSSFFSLQSFAQNYIVNSNIDAVAANLLTGETATAGQITLRSAIQAATAQPGAHIITFSGAVVSPINLTLGQITTGNAANGNNITITGPGMNLLTVNQTTENRIFSTGTGAVTFLLQDITLNYTGPSVLAYSGGGGAIIAGGAGAVTTLINCRITNFQRQLGNGGAISASSSLANHSLTITNCIFTNNRCGGAGGAVSFNSQGGTATITGCIFENNHTGPVDANTGGDGGAISVTGGGSGGTYLIEKNTFLNNQVENVTGHAGAIMSTNGTATIRYNRFVGNTCANTSFPPLANIVGQAGGATTHVTIADNNWWGVNTGPGANDATALASGAVMTLTKWLQLKSTASPNPICASSPSNLGNTSTVTASFLSNSANEAIAVGNLTVLTSPPAIAPLLQVTWSQTLGSLSAQQTTIQASGTATALFTSNGTGGTATVNAQVDNIPAGETSPARANITVNTLSTPPTGATGTTTICNGTSTTLTVSGGLKGTGAVTQWYTGSCGGTLVFTGDAFTTPALTANTNYFVRYSGTCNTTTCATVTVTVLPAVNYGSLVASANHVVISQVYGGGGNTSAPYQNDFIELFNPTANTVNLTGWSVQYASATGTSWTSKTDLTGSIGPGKYYLIKGASGGAVGVALPTEDVAGTINLSATAGKVALVSSTNVITAGTSCPTSPSFPIVDFVGFGTTANCFEGTGPTPAPSNTTAVLRATNGCTDTDNNSADFSAGTPTPRNSASPANTCAGPATITLCSGSIPGSMTVSGASGGSGTFTYQWYSKSGTTCPAGTDISGWTPLGASDGTGYNTATFTPSIAVTSDITFACLVTAAGSPACPPPTWANGCRVVKVNKVTGGTIAASQSLCTPADPAAFTESVASTGDGVLTYQWQSSTTDCTTGFSDIEGETGLTYDPPSGLTITTYYRRVTTSTLSALSCTANSNCVTVTVNPENTVSAPSSTPTLCINTALTNITHTTTVATGIANNGVSGANGLPAGVSATWAANTITISGTPTASGTFNYSILLTGGCGTVSATGTITVTPNNTAGAASSTPALCINTALTNITHSTTGATGIANDGVSGANGLPAGVSATWAANTITISGTPTASGTFNYSILLTGGCGTVSATGTITVTPNNTAGAASSTPTLCINTALTNITHSTTGATGIANNGVSGTNGLPAGVSATWAANTITISGTPTASGTFNYSILLTGGCGTVSATGTITVTPNNSISLTSLPATTNQTVLVSTPITAITYSTTGATGATVSPLPPGVTSIFSGNAIAGTVTISGTPTSIVGSPFNYTVTLTGGCGTVTATGTITVINCSITLSSAAGTNAQTVCNNTPITAITYATTAATGASFSGLPAGLTSGWAANVATISGTPTESGTFNYTVTLTGGGCEAFSASGTIYVNGVTGGTIAEDQTICSGGNPSSFTESVPSTGTALTYQWQSSITDCTTGFSDIVDATGSTYDPPSGLLQTTYYRRVAKSTLNSVVCTANSNCVTVTVNNVTGGTVTADQAICSGGDPETFTETVPSTGTGALTYQWQSSTTDCNSGFSDIGGAVDPTYNPPLGLQVTTYYRRVTTSTLNGAACTANSNCITVTVNPLPIPLITAGGPTVFCAGGSVDLSAVSQFNSYLKLSSPLTNKFSIGTADFGAAISATPLNGDIVYIPDGTASYLGCNPYTPGSLTGKVALIDRGTCLFVYKAKNAEDAGAIGVIIANNVPGGPFNMASGDPGVIVTIPVISVSQADGLILKNLISQGTVNGATFQHTYSYLWSTGATTPSITVTESGDYTVEMTDENGCSGTSEVTTVTVNPIPNAVATPASQSICTGNVITTIVLSSDVAGTVYSWTRDNLTVTGIAAAGSGNISGSLTNSTASPVTVTFTITPTYTNEGVTCTGDEVMATVTVNPNQYFACPGNMVETITDLNIPCFKAVNTPNPVFCGTLTKLTWKLTGATTLSSPTSGINYLGLRNMNVGTTTVTYTATFTGGVVKTCSFTVLVIETVPPDIRCPLDVHVTTSPGVCYRNGPVSLGTPTVSDNCGVLSVTNNAPAVYQKGVNFVTWTVTDKSGNTRSCVQRVTVDDAEKPTITCPANVTANTGPVCSATPVTLPEPVFNDNCGVETLTWAMTGVTWGQSPNTGINYVPTMNYATGVSTITYTAVDASGNQKACTFTVTLKDVTPPTLTCPAAQTFCKVANNNYTVPPLVQSDNCVIVSTTYAITGVTSRTGTGTNASGIFNLGVSTIKWTVKDVNGNTSTCTTTVTVLATSNSYCTPLPFTDPAAVPNPGPVVNSGVNPKITGAEVPGLSVTAWPNPTVNYFNLKVVSPAKEVVEIRVYDMSGKLVQTRTGVAGDTYQLGSRLVSGMYMIEVRQGDKTVRTRVVKGN